MYKIHIHYACSRTFPQPESARHPVGSASWKVALLDTGSPSKCSLYLTIFQEDQRTTPCRCINVKVRWYAFLGHTLTYTHIAADIHAYTQTQTHEEAVRHTYTHSRVRTQMQIHKHIMFVHSPTHTLRHTHVLSHTLWHALSLSNTLSLSHTHTLSHILIQYTLPRTHILSLYLSLSLTHTHTGTLSLCFSQTQTFNFFHTLIHTPRPLSHTVSLPPLMLSL